MFCPNCGNNCGDVKFCPNCSTNLKGIIFDIPSKEDISPEKAEMIRRYGQYMPDKLEAVRVLRQDTGMNAMDAMRTIEELFPEKAVEYSTDMSETPTSVQNEAPITHSDKLISNSNDWKVGMPCPNCGGVQLDGNKCAFCGTQLILHSEIYSTINDDSFVLPRIYYNSGDFIDLKEDTFINREYALFSKKYREYEIAYSQIISITYYRKEKKHNGIIITYDGDRNRTIEISPYDRVEVLYQLFCFLRTVVSASAQIKMDEQYLHDEVDNKWVERIDSDEFFELYNPHQKRARKKIQKLTGLGDQEAASIVAKVFCTRQVELYRVNPSFAIRDLNRAIAEHEYKEEKDRQEREERQRERQRYRRYRY